MLYYVFASILLGLGIAVDVALATIGMARLLVDRTNRRFWIRNVTFTHIVLPMIGYYGFAVATRTVRGLELPLGLAATAMVAWFLGQQFATWLKAEEHTATEQLTFFPVLAVSWDALWSGPAKSAQAVGWAPLQILFSFFIAGAVVATVAIWSAHFALWLLPRLISTTERRKQAIREIIALWVEFSVIGFFGVLAILRYVFQSNVGPFPVLLCSLAISALPFLAFRHRLYAARLYSLSVESEALQNTV